MRRLGLLAVSVALLVTAPASAQQRGTDVGGQPARRKVTKLPRLTTFVEAEYPAEKKAAGIEGAVVLTIEISATGQVVSVAVAEPTSSPDFDEAAVAAAQSFVFEPAEVDDKPAPSKITFRYRFTLSPPVPVPVPTEVPEPVPDPDRIEIRGRPRPRAQPNQITVAAAQARKVAGTQGDVLKVVQNLPGVSRPPVASGQIVMWGSAPRETRLTIDGVDVPALYHGSGLRSIISSDLVSTIDLVPGAFGPEYGRGIGGLVRVETLTLPRGTHGSLAADTLDGSALVSTELGARVRVAIAARQSWLERIFAGVSARDAGDLFPIPRYRDGQMKATVELRRGESLDAVLLGASDDLTRTAPSADPAGTRSEATHTSFWRAYARYTNVSERGDTVTLTPFVGRDKDELEQSFGALPTRLAVGTTRYGVRGLSQSKLGKSVVLGAGIDALASNSHVARAGALTLPPREGDVAVFGQPPGDEYATDDFRATIVDLGPHLFADIRLGPVTLTPGARLDAYLIDGDRKTPRIGQTPAVGFSRLETALAPRMAARWEVAPRLAINAAYGTYHQAPEPEELSAVFGTPDLALPRATHVTFGESVRLTSTLTADVVGFQKSMKDLVVRSRLTNPLLARALTQNGEGRSYGVQLFLRQELWRGFFGWISYAISRSERRFDSDERWRAFDFDQPHVLSVVTSQEVGRWMFGARFRYASGNPRTPVTGSVYDARSDRYDPVFGPQNSIRIPAFWQLDVRVDRSLDLGKGVTLLLYADVQNVTNRENAEEIIYSASFRERGTIRGLPTIGILGARLER